MTVKMYCGNLSAFTVIVVSKIYMVQLLRQIASFIQRYLTVTTKDLQITLKKYLPHSNNVCIFQPLFRSLARSKTEFCKEKYQFTFQGKFTRHAILYKKLPLAQLSEPDSL